MFVSILKMGRKKIKMAIVFVLAHFYMWKFLAKSLISCWGYSQQLEVYIVQKNTVKVLRTLNITVHQIPFSSQMIQIFENKMLVCLKNNNKGIV